MEDSGLDDRIVGVSFGVGTSGWAAHKPRSMPRFPRKAQWLRRTHGHISTNRSPALGPQKEAVRWVHCCDAIYAIAAVSKCKQLPKSLCDLVTKESCHHKIRHDDESVALDKIRRDAVVARDKIRRDSDTEVALDKLRRDDDVVAPDKIRLDDDTAAPDNIRLDGLATMTL